ncbi:hypothetical protein KP509_05G090900 [Ceratopteris richardii]|nr:hypothetical protein KP509_05G090900 [Ceratopteris richardii]
MVGNQKGKSKPTTIKQPVIPFEDLKQPRILNKSMNTSNNNREAKGAKPSSSLSSSAGAPGHPKPAELVERYMATGMAREAASEKVIEDLQAALQRSLYPMQKLASLEKTFRSSATQFDQTSKRLALIESKLDNKPNFPQVFAAGVAAGALLQTAIKASPPVFVALNEVFSNIRGVFQR